jgi:hypothetical protein
MQSGSRMKIGSTALVWKNSSVEYAESTVKIRHAKILNARQMCVTTPEPRIRLAEIRDAKLP